MPRKPGRIALVLLVLLPILAASPSPARGQERKLLPVDPAGQDAFGAAVAVAGGIALVGAPGDDDVLYAGSVSFFDLATGELYARSFGNSARGEYLGGVVALSDVAALAAGVIDSAHVYDPSSGSRTVSLQGDDTAGSDKFGRALALDDSVAIIGAWEDDDNGTTSGSAFLFDVRGGEQLFKLLPEDARARDQFGFAVSISDSLAVVGAPRAYRNDVRSGAVYSFDIRTGVQSRRFLPMDPAWDQYFGWSVALEGELLIVGARGDETNGLRAGAAYVFDVTTGEQLRKLVPDDGAAEDSFGEAVAVSGSRLLIGAPGGDGNVPGSGVAYVFDATTGVQTVKLFASDGGANDYFGHACGLDGATALIGAYGNDNNLGIDAGAAYVFDLAGGTDASPGAPAPAPRLFPNVPNPFNPATLITFDLSTAGVARLEVFDVAGRFVTTLFDGWCPAGVREVQWKGADAHGRRVGSGVYLCRLTTASGVTSRRMVLLR